MNLQTSRESFPHLSRDSPSRLLPGPIPTATPTKPRSLSDSEPAPPKLEPSPQLKESNTRASDDNVLIATPSRPPRRVDLSARGLYLQMPPKEQGSVIASNGVGLGFQSPQFEQRDPYGSPSSVLPRHSRGLDFSRAATNLHHSTLAEQPSPDSSPTINQRSMLPPSRRGSTLSMVLDSPRPGSSWGLPSFTGSEKGSISRSVGSTNAMTSEASSSSSDDDDTLMEQDEDESMVATPQAQKMMGGDVVTPYEPHRWNTEDANGSSVHSPISSAFSAYRKGILGKRHAKNFRDHPYSRNRTSSPEPGISLSDSQNGVFGRDVALSPRSRRESLSMGVGNTLHISSSNEDMDDSPFAMTPSTPGVVRRPVVRRSNMLPKTKNFARIKAALQEESAPVDNEVRRESEVVRQVRVKDIGQKDLITPTSPSLAPRVPNLSSETSELSSLGASGVRGDFNNSTFADFRRGSSGRDFWQRSKKRSSTPPPHAFLHRHRSSSGVSNMSEDVSTDPPNIGTPPSSIPFSMDPKPSVETSNLNSPFQPSVLNTASTFPTAAEITRKINKRRRDDEFDVNNFKRRAVSPGLSVQSSPVLGQSPVSNTGSWPARLSREGSIPGTSGPASTSAEERSQSKSAEDRSASSGSMGHLTPVLGPKRVGLQGMTDTNEALVKMSID